MGLSSGTFLGPYEILSPLGAGGMGEVYRARDPRLGREVAIKVLPEALAADRDRLRRFEQEARSASALNHPNIVTIYDVGRSGSTSYIAMELIEGRSLREILGARPVPLKKLLSIVAPAADGLARAHASGIVHRDLKPENVMVTAQGLVKILDFGLAKLAPREAPDGAASELPTVTRQTEPGAVLGTVGYMSPEQASGREADFRSDQFSLGAILYEMAAGVGPFRRSTAVETMAAIVREEPPPLAVACPGAPAPLCWIVERCLAKEPEERYASTRDLARDLASIRDHLSEADTLAAVLAKEPDRIAMGGARRRRIGSALLASFVVGGLAAGTAVWLWKRTDSSHRSMPRRLSIVPPPGAPLVNTIGRGFKAMALSPRGTHIAYVAIVEDRRQIYLRAIDQLEAKPVPGTERAIGPFFSFDGDWLAFGSEGKLKKVPISGGVPQVLCDAPNLRGGSWGEDDIILFAPDAPSGLFQVGAAGGTPRPVTTRSSEGESHRWPVILPGGKAALFSTATVSGREEERTVAIVSLDTGQRRTLVEGATDPRYVRTGHLLYARAGSILAAPFDPRRLALTGAAAPVVDDVLMDPGNSGLAYYEVAETGTLVYVPGSPRTADRELVWMDRRGRSEPLLEDRRPYETCSLSPEGGRLAVGMAEGSKFDIWIYDLARKTKTRLTFDGASQSAAWSPDGRYVAFVTIQEGGSALFWAPADGSRPPESLAKVRGWLALGSFSPDGRVLAFTQNSRGTGMDIAILPLAGDRTPRPFLTTASHENLPTFSPDGRFLAYASNESGRPEVYVRPYPGPGGKWAISKGGGSAPRWARDGRELFYCSGNKLMVVPVRLQPQFSPGSPQLLFDTRQQELDDYDVAPDGKRFAVIAGLEQTPPQLQFVVAPDWASELQERFRRKSR